MCHGGSGVARAAWVQGLTPTPPYLLDAPRRWTPAQLYWIVGQGIKMTAMPAWRLTRTQGEAWNLVAFLEILPYLSARDYARMRAADTAIAPSARTRIEFDPIAGRPRQGAETVGSAGLWRRMGIGR